MIKSYTYLVGWTKLNLWYYGVRYKQGCSTNDFFTVYFTSSKLIHALMLTHGLPDVREIRRTFDNVKKALVWEQTVLRRLKVLRDEKWLNQNVSGAINFTPAMRQIMSERKKGRVWLTKNNKKTLVRKELVEVLIAEGYQKWHPDNSGKKNGMWGKKHTNVSKNKIKETKVGKCYTSDEGLHQKSIFMKNNNPMHDPTIKQHHKEKMIQLKNASKKVYYKGFVYNSVREAAQHHPHMKYSTLAWSCANKKAGWSYDDPA